MIFIAGEDRPGQDSVQGLVSGLDLGIKNSHVAFGGADEKQLFLTVVLGVKSGYNMLEIMEFMVQPIRVLLET